jgi:hypothetical protein
VAEGPLHVQVEDDTQTVWVDPTTGDVTESQPGGGVVVKFGAAKKAGLGKDDGDDEEWFRNLADDLDGTKLSVIMNDLIAGIKADDESRQGWLNNTTRGLDLLGLKLESPSADVQTTGDGPVMSKVKNPLLLDACLRGWANAEAELLPAAGPVKIKDDGRETDQEDQQAELLQQAVNRYFTTAAVEYYPETSHMLLWGTYFRGSGFKKIYRCPRRKRPVSEKVEPKDLIVSDASTDFRSCGRITHEIEMRPSVFKLMQFIGAYRKTAAAQPNPTPNVVEEKIAAIQGTRATPDRPEDKPYTIWETQCELDLDDFIPKGSKFKGEGVPLPYLVSIDKDNEECLSIRRDWQEDDEWCNRIRMYVKYPYVPGPGFYGTGMLGLLGNSSAAMTAAWREALDAGMFASFPGGFIDKRAVRGNQGGNPNTTFTQGPGEFAPIDTGGGKASDMVVPMPYKDASPGLLALMDKITEQCKPLGQSAEIPAAEGVANVPVGSMLAQIEQATKVMAAAHKGMHNAQSEEIQMIVDIFRRHPDDLLKSDSDSPLDGWTSEQLIEALDNHKLVPVSDPNVPSHIHRVAKALGLIQLYQMPDFKPIMDKGTVLRRVLAAMREDPSGLIVAEQPQQPPLADQAKMVDAQSKAKKVDADIASKGTDNALKLQELQSDQTIHEMDLQKEQTIHAADAEKSMLEAAKVKADVVAKHADSTQAEVDSRRKTGVELVKAGLGAHKDAMQHQQATQQTALQAHQGEQQHQRESQRDANQATLGAQKNATETHKALNPQPPKPKGTGQK